jgi:hypothetical protein
MTGKKKEKGLAPPKLLHTSSFHLHSAPTRKNNNKKCSTTKKAKREHQPLAQVAEEAEAVVLLPLRLMRMMMKVHNIVTSTHPVVVLRTLARS